MSRLLLKVKQKGKDEDKYKPKSEKEKKKEKELIELYNSTKDEDAIGELYKLHVDALISCFMKLTGGSMHDSKDLVQETFRKVLKSKPTIKKNFGGYLMTIGYNIWKSEKKNNKERTNLEESNYLNQKSDSRDVSHPVEQREACDKLYEAINNLPKKQQQAIKLRLEGYTNEEISESMGISKSAVENLISRARKNLK